MSLPVSEFNRDSFDHLNRSVYDFWTTFALSLVVAILVGDFLSAALDQLGPTTKLAGTLLVSVLIFAPGPTLIARTILEGKDEKYIKAILDFPLHPGGLIIDFVEHGIIDLVSSEKEVPRDPNTGKPTGEAKVPENKELLEEVIKAKALGWYSFAIRVEVPQRRWPRQKPAYQPIDDLACHSDVPRSKALVPEEGSGVFKGVAMRKLAHQCVIGGFYTRSIRYNISAKPVPIIRLTFSRGKHLQELTGAKLTPMTAESLSQIENAYSTIGSVTTILENQRLTKENEELQQRNQNTTWDNHAKAAEAYEHEKQAFGGKPRTESAWKFIATGRGIFLLIIFILLGVVVLYFAAAYFAPPKPASTPGHLPYAAELIRLLL